jgi:selenoprotein W-related protein
VEKAIGIRPQLIEGSGGVFDVKADGRTIFSRKEAGRFPEDAEVIKALRKLKAK